MLNRPVLVTGTPRSGKTCVSKILACAPEFRYLDEPLTMWDAGIGVGRQSDDCRNATEATPEIRRRITSMCERAVQDAGKRRYLDNLSYHALRVPFVRAVMPDVRIIHVVRDAQDAVPEMYYGWTYKDTVSDAIRRRRKQLNVRALPRLGFRFIKNYVSSRIRKKRSSWGPRVPGLQEFAASHSTAETAAYQWMNMIEIAQSDLGVAPADSWMEVRYEDLVENPVALTEQISSFAEVESPDQVVEYAQQFLNPDHEFLKTVALTEAEWSKIDDLTRNLRTRLGYHSTLRSETPTT